MPAEHIIIAVTNDTHYDRRMLRIAESLQGFGYVVNLVGCRKRHTNPLPLRPFNTHLLPCYFQRGPLFYLEYNLRLLAYLLHQHADWIYAVDLDTLLPCVVTARIRSRRCVYDAHEYFSETPEVERRPLIQKIWRIVAKLAIPYTQVRFTVGDALAKELTQVYRKPFGVVRNVPVLRSAVTKAVYCHSHIILYQGVLNEGRGLETAIRAMRHLPEAQLWLVGEGDLSTQLRALTVTEGVESQVRFWGYLSPEDLSAVTVQACIGINLLENRSRSYYLSLANKTFDYIHAGVPGVHMDFPEYRKLVTEHHIGILLSDLSVQAYVAAVRRLLDDETLRHEMQKACMVAANDLNWQQEFLHLVALLKAAEV